MSNETCANEALVLAARRSGGWDADLLRHLRGCSVCSELADVAESIGNLASLAGTPALPDPDWLWMRAQLLARQDAAAKALWMSTLRRAPQYGALAVGAAWLLLEWLATERASLDAWTSTIASLSVDPLLNVAVSTIAALGSALVTGGLFFARSFLARQLRYVGLL